MNRKFCAFALSFLIVFVGGCSSTNNEIKNEINNDVFALKEKCSKYIEKEKERFAKENPHLKYTILDGLFYSRNLNTCVAKWDWNNDNGQQFYGYVDVLTNKSLNSFLPFEKNNNGVVQIDKKRDNEIVKNEANAYEKTLDLVK